MGRFFVFGKGFKYKIPTYTQAVIARRLCDEAIFSLAYQLDCFVVPKAALLAMTNRCSIVVVWLL
jgi:hypothetical protein